MKWTNKLNLPEPVFNALVINNHVTNGEISVTQSLREPYQDVLMRKHSQDIEKDVSDNIWALFGTAIHHILEMGSTENDDYNTEMKLTVKVPLPGEPYKKWQMSGSADLYTKKTFTLQDYKSISVFKYKNKDYDDWTEQLNMYAYMARQKGIRVDKIQIVAILKDWRKGEAMREWSYPQCPIALINLPLWENEKTWDFIKERIALHYIAREKGKMNVCSDKYCWKRPDVWKVIKKGNKRATKNHTVEADAIKHCEELNTTKKGEFIITFQKGEYTRCMGYCDVKIHCERFK